MFFNREIKKILIMRAKKYDLIEVISTFLNIMYTTMSEWSKRILGVFSVTLFY